MDGGYKVCAKEAESEFTEKKSRFISYLALTQSEDEAREFIDGISARHRDATHNCYAYRIYTPRIERFSDAGEPSGTAGMPMLGVLKKEDVYNVCVVVTRYFGGILLGGGGLIRAYSRAVTDAVSKAGFAVRSQSVTLSLVFGYDGYRAVMKLIDETVATEPESLFGGEVTVKVTVRADCADAFIENVKNALCGAVKTEVVSRGFDSFK